MKLRTNEIRKYIVGKIESLGINNVYYKQASNMSTFPYIVYDLDANFTTNMTLYDLEINVWDNSSNLTNIEDLADKIEDLLEDDMNLSGNGLLIFDKVERGNIDDPNKDLNRIMIKFNMRYFK